MKKEHIVDIIYSHIVGKEGTTKRSAVSLSAPKSVKKIFLSDWDVRKIYDRQKKELRIPSNAIISPLSMDWIEYNEVKIIRQ